MKNILLFFNILLSVTALAQSGIFSYGFPQLNFPPYHNKVKIDTADVVFEPQGNFTKVTTKLTFSVNDYNGKSDDSLEIHGRFKLPENAIVTDMHLWIYDTIMDSHILDRNLAVNYYNFIVNRRIDPSLLIKNTDVDYELFIYPVTKNFPRTLDITFLIENNFSNDLTQASLKQPLAFLDGLNIPHFFVGFKPNSYASSYTFNANFSSAPALYQHPIYGAIERGELSQNEHIQNLSYTLHPTKNYLASNFSLSADTHYLQLGVIIDSLGQYLSSSKKILFVVDYNINHGAMTPHEIDQILLESIEQNLLPTDSVNFIFSANNKLIQPKGWIPADSSIIKQHLKSNINQRYASFNNTLSSISTGFNEFKSVNYSLDIVLLTNYINPFSLNSLAHQEHQKIMSNLIQNHIRFSTIYCGSKELNDYFTYSAVEKSNGKIVNVNLETVNEYNKHLNELLTDMSVFFHSIKCNFSQSQSTYSKSLEIKNTASPQKILADENFYFTTSIFVGSLPKGFNLNLITPKGQNLSIFDTISTIIQADEHNQLVYYKAELDSLDKLEESIMVDSAIYKTSTKHHILHKNTALLCLEPGMQIPGDFGTLNPIILSEQEQNQAKNHNEIEIFPNPVKDNINIILPKNYQLPATIKLFSISGQLLTQQYISNENNHLITIDISHYSVGIYFIQLSNEEKVITSQKIVKE